MFGDVTQKFGRFGGYLIVALAAFLLLCVWAEYFGPVSYGVLGRYERVDGSIFRVTRVAPELQRYGIEPGTRIDFRALSFTQRRRFLSGGSRDSLVDVPVVSTGGTRIVRLPATVERPHLSSFVGWFAMLAGMIALGITGYVGYRRPGIMTAALVLYTGSVVVNVSLVVRAMATVLPDGALATIWASGQLLLGALGAFALASFVIRFPGETPSAPKRMAIRAIDALVVVAASLKGLLLLFPDSPLNSGAAHRVESLAIAVFILVAAALSLRFTERTERGRAGLVFGAVILAAIVNPAKDQDTVMLAAVMGPSLNEAALADLRHAILEWLPIPMVLIVPVAVAYATLRHRIFDVAFVLNRALAYALTWIVLLVMLAALEFLAERFISSLSHAEGLAIEFGITVIVIVCAKLVHQRVDRIVDNFFFRTRLQQESALRRFATAAHFYEGAESLIRDSVAAIVRYGRVEGAAIYSTAPDGLRPEASNLARAEALIPVDDPAFVTLRAHREAIDLDPAVTAIPGVRAYPMVVAGRLVGALCVGERESGEEMPPDIDAALQAVATSIGASLAAIETTQIRAEVERLRSRLSKEPSRNPL